MPTPTPAPTDADRRELEYLATPAAIRERAGALYALAAGDALEHFALDLDRLPAVAERIVAVTRARYPDAAAIPFHSRWRHFGVGGVDRAARLATRMVALPRDERLRARFDLAIVSVLLDAGAGDRWTYREPATGLGFTRSEGLAVASFDLFAGGGLSDDPARAPLRADARRLEAFSDDDLASAFQVSGENPLVGLAGRAALLRRLGATVRANARLFPGGSPRPGNLADFLRGADGGASAIAAARVLGAVLEGLGPIWPGRETLGGVSLGDVWRHPRVGWVPFHKLSQWLTYSLLEPLADAGMQATGLDELTGLAEYRNGGLFLDGGVIRPRDPDLLARTHDVGSDVVVEWRALTVALLDRAADLVCRLLGVEREALPLCKVLEGGTWAAGRQIAGELRPDGSPPLKVKSDGTVF